MPRTERSVKCRSIPNKPKQTINNGGPCVAIDVNGFANLHRHPIKVNPMCSCLIAIAYMAVQRFCRLVVHGNPAPSPCRKPFFLLFRQCFGATCLLTNRFSWVGPGALGVERQRTSLKLGPGPEQALELPWWKRGMVLQWCTNSRSNSSHFTYP